LVIERGAASVSASAVALGDGDVGDVVSFKVETTQKVLRGRIETRERARVVVR
jgi:flagella basal body P-ring formation protein FlgA